MINLSILDSLFTCKHSELHGIQDYVGAGVVLPNYDYEDISKLSALVVLTSIMLQKLLSIYDGNLKPIITVFK